MASCLTYVLSSYEYTIQYLPAACSGLFPRLSTYAHILVEVPAPALGPTTHEALSSTLSHQSAVVAVDSLVNMRRPLTTSSDLW